MRAQFQRIFKEFQSASKESYTNHPLANFIRNDLVNKVSDLISNTEGYLIHSSAGSGAWVACPWLAIFDVLVTMSAQKGFYPVFIFREDMSGVYLSLSQGVTSVTSSEENGIKKNRQTILRENARNFRNRIGEIPLNFKEINIDLKQDKATKSHLPKDYEAGNIIAKFYDANDLPSDKVFKEDIIQILNIYKSLTNTESIASERNEEDEDIENIKKSTRTETQKKRLINARLGQGDFRKSVIKKEKKCRVTGINELKFLIASHIKPWSKSNDEERLDGNNGLLLSPHIDKLFDKGWISFSDDGTMLKKPEVEGIIKAWKILDDNVGKFNPKQCIYLAEHRKKFNF